MFPVRSRVVMGLGDLTANDDILLKWDVTFNRVHQKTYHETNEYLDEKRRKTALDAARAAAQQRIMEPLPYKGHTITAEFFEGGNKIRWHLSQDGKRLSTHTSPQAAKMVVDKIEQEAQQKEVRSWSNMRVSDHARMRGLPTLDVLEAAKAWEVEPLKGPITRALEQGNPVTAIPVRTAGGEVLQVDVSQAGKPAEKGNAMPALLLAGGAVLVGYLVIGGGN